ncbi:MAG TPA: hypothetical protein VGC79_18275 [Polyangiaceae bacterium]
MTPARHVEVTAEPLQRGKKLASLLCVQCHLDPTTGKLTGKVLSHLPPQFGKIVSKNITRSRQKGIGAWSDGARLPAAHGGSAGWRLRASLAPLSS